MSFLISCIYIVSLKERLFLLKNKDIFIKIRSKVDERSNFQNYILKWSFNQITRMKLTQKIYIKKQIKYKVIVDIKILLKNYHLKRLNLL